MTIPAAETKSIGLLADAPLSWFLHRRQASYIMTLDFSSVYQIRKTGSGQFLQPGQIYLSPGLQKLRHGVLHDGTAFRLKHRD